MGKTFIQMMFQQKINTNTSIETVHKLFSRARDSEATSADWREESLMKLPKKGDLQEGYKFRGIILLSVPRKIESRIILDSLSDAIRNNNWMNWQASDQTLHALTK